jgi:hypothetical protein
MSNTTVEPQLRTPYQRAICLGDSVRPSSPGVAMPQTPPAAAASTAAPGGVALSAEEQAQHARLIRSAVAAGWVLQADGTYAPVTDAPPSQAQHHSATVARETSSHEIQGKDRTMNDVKKNISNAPPEMQASPTTEPGARYRNSLLRPPMPEERPACARDVAAAIVASAAGGLRFAAPPVATTAVPDMAVGPSSGV